MHEVPLVQPLSAPFQSAINDRLLTYAASVLG